MTVALLESQVLAKPYFRPEDLLVAEENGKVVGSVHLVYPAPWPVDKAQDAAIIPLLNVAKGDAMQVVEDHLLESAETRIAMRGAQVIYLGGTESPGPYYFGLVGGSCNRGVSSKDSRLMDLSERRGYTLAGSWSVFQRTLRGFRAPVDRNQIAARRSLNVTREDDPVFQNFQEACIFTHQHRTLYQLTKKLGAEMVASLTVVQMEAFSNLRGVRMAGIVDGKTLDNLPDVQAKFFLAEVLRQLAEEGTAVAEVQIPSNDSMLRDVLQDLAFEPVEQLWQLVKTLDSSA